MRHLPCLLALLAMPLASVAHADAIMPFEGQCPPGLDRGIRNHREACVPRACERDADCGEGASCATLCTCRAERTFRGSGRVIYDEPVTRVVEIGLCDGSGACSEGEVAERRQCEPEAATPAFDRATHTWTGESHSAAPPTEPETDEAGREEEHGSEGPADAPEEEDHEEEASGGGCAIAGSGSARWGAGWLALAAALSLARRRFRRSRGRSARRG